MQQPNHSIKNKIMLTNYTNNEKKIFFKHKPLHFVQELFKLKLWNQ